MIILKKKKKNWINIIFDNASNSTVASIEFNAFDGCSSLEQISISAFDIKIDDYAFKDCSSLKFY